MANDWDSNYQWDASQTWNATPTVQPQQRNDELPFRLPQPKKEKLDKWTVPTDIPNIKATLSIPDFTHTFLLNPDTAQWSYQDNVVSMDTLGGRVVQLLSVKLNGLTITARAGYRKELQRIAENLKKIMNYHVNTMNPAILKVPSRNWDFVVYLTALPQLGWDLTSTSYPYQMEFAVEQDLRGVKTKQISNTVISNLAKQIGYRDDIHGGNAQKFYSIIETISQPLTNEGDAPPDDSNNPPGDPDGGAGAWGGYSNGKIPYSAMVKIGNGPRSACCGAFDENGALYLEPNAADAYKRMNAASPYNILKEIACAYRSYDYQKCLYDAYYNHTCSGIYNPAKPGTSPHGWGKALDVNKDSQANQWMRTNGNKYGWDWYGSGDEPHFSYVG